MFLVRGEVDRQGECREACAAQSPRSGCPPQFCACAAAIRHVLSASAQARQKSAVSGT